MLRNSPTSSIAQIIRQLPKATVFVNERFEVVYASDSWLEDFQLDSEQAVGTSISELFTVMDCDDEDLLSDLLSGNSDNSLVYRKLSAGANETWFEWTCGPWCDDQQNIIGLIVQAENITGRKRTEAQNHMLQRHLTATSEIGKIGTWEYCFLEREVTWCEMTRKIHGVPQDFHPTLEEAVNFFKDGHSRNTIAMVLHAAMEKSAPWSEKLQILTEKGDEKWILSAGRPIFEDGEAVGLTGTFQDIDDQVRSENEIKKSENLLRTLVDNLPLSVFIKDTESRKILVNKAECRFLGVDSPEALLGKTDFEHYDPEVAEISRNQDLDVMENLKPLLGQEMVIKAKNGAENTFLISKIPLLDASGKATGLIGFSLDISNIKQKEEELQDIVSVASLQNKKLINFAHIVSHNLRSHTANFSMLLEFLENEKDEAEKNNILRMLTEASDNLLETLENLNEVVVINTNVNLDKERISLGNKIDTVTKNLSALLKENDAKVVNEVSESVEISVIPAYIDSILMNFMSNAVRYKDSERHPHITLSAKRKGGYLVLSIADNGLGIDLEQYGTKLFGMYKTFHDRCDARGIGLYITKNQIEAMNGKVSVESEVGVGSTFHIHFREQLQ